MLNQGKPQTFIIIPSKYTRYTIYNTVHVVYLFTVLK